MESAREFTLPPGSATHSYDQPAGGSRPDHVVVQVDATASTVDGFAWLMSRRDAEQTHRLASLHQEAAAQHWSWAELTRARLRQLRPRRAEVNELGAAYLSHLSPGVGEAIQSMRRAGMSISLASDVGAEALFGVAAALGVSPSELQAPRLRFDAIGAYVGCDVPAASHVGSSDAASPGPVSGARTWYVGTRRSAMFAPRAADAFVLYTALVAHEGRADAAASVDSFADLVALALR